MCIPQMCVRVQQAISKATCSCSSTPCEKQTWRLTAYCRNIAVRCWHRQGQLAGQRQCRLLAAGARSAASAKSVDANKLDDARWLAKGKRTAEPCKTQCCVNALGGDAPLRKQNCRTLIAIGSTALVEPDFWCAEMLLRPARPRNLRRRAQHAAAESLARC